MKMRSKWLHSEETQGPPALHGRGARIWGPLANSWRGRRETGKNNLFGNQRKDTVSKKSLHVGVAKTFLET